MASDHPVERIDQPGRTKSSQSAAERAGEPELVEDRDAPTAVSSNGSAITEDEPPTLAAAFLRLSCQQSVRLVVGERK